MRRSTERILTTHTGSLPRTGKVVDLLLAEHERARRRSRCARGRRRRGGHRRGRAKQQAAGIDVINDGEQGRTDYTVHVVDRLTGFEGTLAPPRGTGEPEFPELAQLLSQFASPFQRWPACSGPVTWKDWPAVEADIARAKAAMSKAGVAESFMTSPSPGQIARYLANQHYKTVEEYLFTLADVMAREYRAIVEAGFVLQLDCPDLAMSYALYPGISLADYRKIISLNVEALNHSIKDLPADRMRMHVCWGIDARPASRRHPDQGHRRYHPQGQAAGGVVPRRQSAPRP